MNVIIASIMGLSLCLMIKAISAADDFQSNTVFVAELSKNIFPGQVITAVSLLSDMPQIDRNSVEHIPATKALATMKEDMPELDYMADNPFHDVIIFKTQGINNKNIDHLSTLVMDINGVTGLYNDAELIATLEQSSKRARQGLFILSLIILIGSLSALCLRIKRDLRPFSNDIRIMSLAGSTDQDIISVRRLWSAKWGTISAILAALIMILNIIFINNTLFDGLEITFLQSVISVLIMMALVIIVHVSFTHYSIKTYLGHINTSIT